MRILNISLNYFPALGGAELHIQRISEELVVQGHVVYVLTSPFKYYQGYFRFGIERMNVKRYEEINGVQVVRAFGNDWIYAVGNIWLKVCPWEKLREWVAWQIMKFMRFTYAKMIQEVIKKHKIDVVLVTPRLMPTVKITLSSHQMKPFPLVILPLLHEEDPSAPKAEYKKCFKKANAIISNTSFEANQLKTYYGVPEKKTFEGGVGVDVLPHTQKKVNTKYKQVLFFGRKTLAKGIPELIKAMQIVWEYDPSVQLVIGGARDLHTAKVEELFNNLPTCLKGNLVSLDNLSENEKTKLFQTAYCFAFPSKYESFGIALLEAWAYSLPIVTLDIPVFRSFIEHNENGLLVQPDNIEKLAEAIIYLLKNPKEAQRMGENGRKKAESEYSWKAITKRYVPAYRFAYQEFITKQ